MASGLKATATATISNLNCGFDCLGLSTHLPADEMIGRRKETPGIVITEITGAGKKDIPLDPTKNTAGVALQHFLTYTGMHNAGIEISIHKHIASGSGLGSSASSACAAVVLANALFGSPLTQAELIPLALLGEHASSNSFQGDTIGPCMMGGIVLTRDYRQLDFQRLALPRGLYITVAHPNFRVHTGEARQILAREVPLQKVVYQSGNVGAFVLALERNDIGLLSRALQDHIVEPQRSALIPGFADVRDAAYQAGALGCGITGAGPSMFAFSQNTLTAEEVGIAMQRAFKAHQVECTVMTTTVNPAGAQLQ